MIKDNETKLDRIWMCAGVLSKSNTATVSLLRKHLRFRKTKLIKMGWISKHLKTKNPESSSHCHCLKGHHKTHPYWLLKVLVVNEQTHLERHRIACRLSWLWQAADWHTPLSRPFNRGKLWKNDEKWRQNTLEDARKTVENEEATSQKWRSILRRWNCPHTTGAYILPGCHTKVTHTSLKIIQLGKAMPKRRQDHAKL